MPTIITPVILADAETTDSQTAIIIEALDIAIAYAAMVGRVRAVKKFKNLQLYMASEQSELPEEMAGQTLGQFMAGMNRERKDNER